MKITRFTGGALETNAFLLELPGGVILVDAPTGSVEWLRSRGIEKLDWLLLTHGHFDHIDAAAAVEREFDCRIGYHIDGEPLIKEPDHFRRMGFDVEVEPLQGGELIEETARAEFCGEAFQVFLVPGHCPGSLCFYHAASGNLLGGDVLFAGGIGRWDLPAGDLQLLLDGIHTKLMPLPDDTAVHPGHGPSTTIGAERKSNPFLQG